jgi:hypothetical protein
MINSSEFWSDHDFSRAVEIVSFHLGDAMPQFGSNTFKGQHVLLMDFVPEFDPAAVEKQIRKELDEIDWQFVTTGGGCKFRGQTLLTFGIAPILPKKLTIGYHATRISVIRKVCDNGEGLLLSNAERRATHLPDTEGVIHICEKLTHDGDENDSAEWWMETLSQKNNFNDPNYGIVQIDMTRLPYGARVYQDMHSASGVIVDKIDRIPAELIVRIK